jgi:ubiquinol-cytochrome c reductase cytochrome c1 subunit
MLNKENRMNRKLSIIAILVLSFFCSLSCYAEEAHVKLDKAHIDPTDQASLQRGAKLYMNYCLGCHGIQYERYNVMAQDIGIVGANGKVLEDAVKANLMFNTDKITDSIDTSMKKEDGVNWFGIAPPDLSLETRYRGVDWVYTYLRAFYLDPKRPWGVNNHVYPDVGMPDVLFNLRKQLKPEEFDAAILDLVNFLNYVADPSQLVRKRIGVWVLAFLGIFLIFAYLLKREYWKDVH